MINDKAPATQRALSVAPSSIEIVLADDGAGPLALVLPPLNDMNEMAALKAGSYSMRERTEMRQDILEQYFSVELATMEKKRERFANSQSFLGKMADLAELAGKRDVEVALLRDAFAIRGDPRFLHRIADNLIWRRQFTEATRLFGEMNLESDAYANLRLAFLKIQQRDFVAALGYTTKAVGVAPLSFGGRLLEGALRLASGEFQLAIRSFRVAAEIRPNSSAVYANMGAAFAYLKRPDKALGALRRAVALDPLNQNAIAFLSDLAFREHHNEDAVPSLRLFLQYEQKDARMWARLARALLELGEVNESIAALKRQGALDNSAAVWNNLGVAYCVHKDGKRALESFKHAMKIEIDKPTRDFYLAARNLSVLMSKEASALDTVRFVEAVVAEDEKRDFALMAEHDLSDLYAVEIGALFRMGEYEDALKMSRAILANPRAATNLKASAISGIIANLALTEEDKLSAIAFAKQYESLLHELPPRDKGRFDQLVNNIAFAYIEAGLLDEAERYLKMLTSVFHKDAYPTATLGLFHFRKGHVDRAEQLYEEAITLALRSKDKSRIRQKLNLEIARRLLEDDPHRAARLLDRVVNAKEGDIQLVNIAQNMKRRFLGAAKS